MMMKQKKDCIFIPIIIAVLVFTGCASTSRKSSTTTPSEMIQYGLELTQKGNYDSAIEQFRGVMDNYPLSHHAVEAQLHLADTYYEKGSYEDGASYYTDFVTLHPSHPMASYAQFKKGMGYFKDTLSIDRDPTAAKKAIIAFDDLLTFYPSSIYSDKARKLRLYLMNRLAEREYAIGSFYFKKKNYKAALKRFLPIVREYPEADVADTVLFYSGKSYIEIGEVEQAGEIFTTLVNQHPHSPYADRARRLLKRDG